MSATHRDVQLEGSDPGDVFFGIIAAETAVVAVAMIVAGHLEIALCLLALSALMVLATVACRRQGIGECDYVRLAAAASHDAETAREANRLLDGPAGRITCGQLDRIARDHNMRREARLRGEAIDRIAAIDREHRAHAAETSAASTGGASA